MTVHEFNISDFNKVVTLAKDQGLDDEYIINIINSLAKSGGHFESQDDSYADIPSTGGPSSLSTLICPYFLTEFGLKVPKLGVKGRPAGGIDVLAQIKNFRINYSLQEVKNIITTNNYCHFIADKNITPLDAKFFKYRSENNAKAIPELVIASILSKKVAMGIKHMGIDIRYFSGANFGETYECASKNALKFIKVAKQLNINCTAFLTDLNNPLQPYIGRGEALLALNNVFTQNMNSWLKSHFDDCLKMAYSISPFKRTFNFNHEKLYSSFKRHLQSQGSNIESFHEKVEDIKSSDRYQIHSMGTGFLNINLSLIRSIIVKYQSYVTNVPFPDNIGIILLKQGDDFVYKGEPVCSLRYETSNIENNIEAIIKEFLQAFTIKNELPLKANLKILNL
jgi:thymidine phosphorylase